MKGSRMIMILCCVMVLLALALEAEAASARVRCRVKDGRVKISVDGQDLAPGDYTATITSGTNSATSGAQTATALVPDLDFDFDSTAGDPGDLDTAIPPDFAAVGSLVNATINTSPAGAEVSSASTDCVAN